MKGGIKQPNCFGGKINRMRPSELLSQNRDTIRQLVLRFGMANPRVFGSALSGEDAEASDLDLLVDPSPDTSLLDLAKLKVEIESVMGIKVDLLTPKFLPETFRDRVLSEAVPV
jgi:uncharacterized protein